MRQHVLHTQKKQETLINFLFCVHKYNTASDASSRITHTAEWTKRKIENFDKTMAPGFWQVEEEDSRASNDDRDIITFSLSLTLWNRYVTDIPSMCALKKKDDLRLWWICRAFHHLETCLYIYCLLYIIYFTIYGDINSIL
jgi:hypothetical protein